MDEAKQKADYCCFGGLRTRPGLALMLHLAGNWYERPAKRLAHAVREMTAERIHCDLLDLMVKHA